MCEQNRDCLHIFETKSETSPDTCRLFLLESGDKLRLVSSIFSGRIGSKYVHFNPILLHFRFSFVSFLIQNWIEIVRKIPFASNRIWRHMQTFSQDICFFTSSICRLKSLLSWSNSCLSRLNCPVFDFQIRILPENFCHLLFRQAFHNVTPARNRNIHKIWVKYLKNMSIIQQK